MTSSPRDGQSLDLPPELISYVKSLNEPIEKYSPYFDALFIRPRNHRAFFQDLKDFRCQGHVIALLTSSPPQSELNELYRSCSRLFLESRFAHPWCRTTPLSEGWSKAEWGRIKKQSEAKKKDEERLHKLLVPIWCGFRVRMMPTEEQLERFLLREKESQAKIPIKLGFSEPAKKLIDFTEQKSPEACESELDSSLSGEAKISRPQTSADAPTRFNAEAFVSEDDDRTYEQRPSRDDDGAATAGKIFFGVAATSFLESNPRARKYLWKKLQK